MQAKIRNHAVIHDGDVKAQRKLLTLATEVRSGDPMNVEGQAARVHWAAWRRAYDAKFTRDPDGLDIANALLNYGYAVLRAAVARAIVGAGLHPALGVHHHNRANAFCLADDLMEPLRPMIDRRVGRLVASGVTEIDQPAKAQLLDVLVERVEAGGEIGPLMVALPRVVASLSRCLRREQTMLTTPRVMAASPGGTEGECDAD